MIIMMMMQMVMMIVIRMMMVSMMIHNDLKMRYDAGMVHQKTKNAMENTRGMKVMSTMTMMMTVTMMMINMTMSTMEMRSFVRMDDRRSYSDQKGLELRRLS